MYLQVSLWFDASRLAGHPKEYAPLLSVWSTDRTRTDTAKPGMAVHQMTTVACSRGHGGWVKGRRSVRLAVPPGGDPGDFPVTDADAEFCVAVHASTRSSGCTTELTDTRRPYRIRIGQVNVRWHSILKHMVEHTTTKFKVRVTVASLAGYEGVLYLQNLHQDDDEAGLLTTHDAQDETTRGSLIIKVALKNGSLSDLLRAFRAMPADAEERAVERDRRYATANKHYLREYLKLFPRERHGQLHMPAHLPHAPLIVFKPDTVNMERFHLAQWAVGTDHIPFAEWWLRTLTRPRVADATTEAFVANLAVVGLNRAYVSADVVIRVVREAFGNATSVVLRARYAQLDTPEHALLVRAVEATYYTATALAHSCRYTSDGRYTNVGVRVEVEAPQQDMAGGMSDAGDCEDLEKVLGVFAAVVVQGRSDRDGQWTHVLLIAMQTIMRHYVTLHTFGSVLGAQVSDATSQASVSSSSPEAPLHAANPLALGRVLSEDDDAGTRFHWHRRLRTERPGYYAHWTHFAAMHPDAVQIIWSELPSHDDDVFWGRAALWIDHYIARRAFLTLESLEARHGINVVSHSDGTFSVLDERHDARPLHLSETELTARYTDGVPLHLVPVLDVAELSDVRAGDLYAGDYASYTDRQHMHALFQLANVLLSWQGDSPIWGQLVVYAMDGEITAHAVTRPWLQQLVSEFVVHARANRAPRAGHVPLVWQRVTRREPTNIAQSNWRGTIAARRLDEHYALLVAKYSAQLPSDVVAWIRTPHATLKTLRTSMPAAFKEVARRHPKAFWLVTLAALLPHRMLHYVALLETLHRHHLDDDLSRQLAVHEKQVGAYRFWRNMAMWLIFLADVDSETMRDAQASKHATVHWARHSLPADRRVQGILLVRVGAILRTLGDDLSRAEDAHFVRDKLFPAVVLALSAFAVAPTGFNNVRERNPHLGAVTGIFPVGNARSNAIGPFFLAQFTHDTFKQVSERVFVLQQLEVRFGAFYALYQTVLDHVPDLETTLPVVGNDHPMWRRLLAWLWLYVEHKLRYLVRVANHAMQGRNHGKRVFLRYLHLDAIGITSAHNDAKGTLQSRKAFLQAHFQVTALTDLRLIATDTLDFYAWLQHTDTRRAGSLIHMDRLLIVLQAHHKERVGGYTVESQATVIVAMTRVLRLIGEHNPDELAAPHRITVRGMHALSLGLPKLASADRLRPEDRIAINVLARVPTEDLWRRIRANPYLEALERTHPFHFWLLVIRARLPWITARAEEVFGFRAIKRFSLPPKDDVRWRNLLPWIAFYLQVLFTDSIEQTAPFRYTYVDLNRIYDHLGGVTLTFMDYIAFTQPGRTPREFMHDGLFVNPDDYDASTVIRLTAIDHVMTALFDDDLSDAAATATFKADVASAVVRVLRHPTAPPLMSSARVSDAAGTVAHESHRHHPRQQRVGASVTNGAATTLRVRVLTWNMSGKDNTHSVSGWNASTAGKYWDLTAQAAVQDKQEVVVVCLQEVHHADRFGSFFHKRLNATAARHGRHYEMHTAKNRSFVSLIGESFDQHLYVYHLAPASLPAGASMRVVKRGSTCFGAPVAGQATCVKGTVGQHLVYTRDGNTTEHFLFLCSHFPFVAQGDAGALARNAAYHKTTKKLVHTLTTVHGHTVPHARVSVVWAGDLNYRKMSNGHDQLSHERATRSPQGGATPFPAADGWTECGQPEGRAVRMTDAPSFPPTCKMRQLDAAWRRTWPDHPDTMLIHARQQGTPEAYIHTTAKGQARVPSHCDRVLYRRADARTVVSCTMTKQAAGAIHSDHDAVLASLVYDLGALGTSNGTIRATAAVVGGDMPSWAWWAAQPVEEAYEGRNAEMSVDAQVGLAMLPTVAELGAGAHNHPHHPRHPHHRHHNTVPTHVSETAVAHDKMLIDTPFDREMDIGGHMFALFAPTSHLSMLYQRHDALLTALYGDDDGPHHSVHAHVQALVTRMVGVQGDTAEARDAARALLGSLPVLVGEGTGRQELLLLPGEAYFGRSTELLERAARHIAGAEALRAWGKTRSEDSEPHLPLEIYGFQAAIFQDELVLRDPVSGKTYERRVSAFYRRLGHGCSEGLHAIDARFRHLIWVRPETMRFGANIRHFLEGGDAMPIPAPSVLADAYLGGDDDRLEEALEVRGKRIAPYQFTFDTPEQAATAATASGGSSRHRSAFAVRTMESRGKRQEGQGGVHSQRQHHTSTREPLKCVLPSDSSLARLVAHTGTTKPVVAEMSYLTPKLPGPLNTATIDNAATVLGTDTAPTVEFLTPATAPTIRMTAHRAVTFQSS